VINRRIYVPTGGAEDWKRFLAEPDKHWKPGRSAHALATSWEIADAFPARVKAVLDGCADGFLRDLELVAAIPEYQTPLPGGMRPSQTDLLVIARNARGLVVAAVESKVDEPFGPTVAEWRDGTPGKERRLAYLCDLLALSPDDVGELRYQLFHRAAAALIEAERLHAHTALMLVHSFSPQRARFSDYAAFAEALCAHAEADAVCAVGSRYGRDLSLAWVTDETAR